MAGQQLKLDVDPPLAVIPVCHHCGASGEPIPVEDGHWGPATKWAIIALAEHEKECPARAAR